MVLPDLSHLAQLLPSEDRKMETDTGAHMGLRKSVTENNTTGFEPFWVHVHIIIVRYKL